MRKTFIFLLIVLFANMVYAQENENIFFWESPDGSVMEDGGTIVQHNFLSSNRINYYSSGYYTIQLIGKKENMCDTDNTLNSIYFQILLSKNNSFKAGDIIEITAMRNNDDGGKSNIHFVFGNGTVVDDYNTWANIGQLHETSFTGGTEARHQTGTEPITTFDFAPSTNEFVIPTEAEGSTTLSFTRNESECRLYITKIVIKRKVATSIEYSPTDNKKNEILYNIFGHKLKRNNNGILIRNGVKRIINNY